ncbi:MAG: hypothetical protein ABL921_06470 [Pirellula sp.]
MRRARKNKISGLMILPHAARIPSAGIGASQTASAFSSDVNQKALTVNLRRLTWPDNQLITPSNPGAQIASEVRKDAGDIVDVDARRVVQTIAVFTNRLRFVLKTFPIPVRIGG